ncbi:MAG: hypothetical protein KJ698_04230 [Actinobacteria bacterium]|nr:hypothetical protein [Actinomycetota bacterium]MBU1493486.1 hypothetical protein [Actinomycetota bacterium]MBU1864994.1 hypothetical protein [Actinomycetota bacterium]
MAPRLVSGECRFTSPPFSNTWALWCRGERLATMTRRPRQHTSDVSLADGGEIRLQPDGWGTVVALENGSELGRIVRRSWWGRRWDLISPAFGYVLTSDPMPRHWTIRVGNEPVGRLSGGLLSYNRLTVEADVGIQVLALVMAWHVLARPWEAAAAPGSLVPADRAHHRTAPGFGG